VQRLPLLTEAERSALAGPVAPGQGLTSPCLHERFGEQVARTPEAVAACCGDAALTYAELNQRANALARRLAALGVGPETLVGLSLERSLDLVVGILGILKAGGAYLPLDPAYPRERLAFMVEDARVPVIVTQRALEASLPAGPAARVLMEELGPGVEENSRSGATASNLAYVIYTSGSTGKPKGCEITHGNVTRLFESTDAWFGFGPQDVWTLFHSYAFDFTVWELWGALLYGGRLVVVPYWVSRSPEAFLDLLCRERVTVLNQTPSAFRQLVQAEITSGGDPQALSLRYVVFGGEALDLQSLRPWYSRHGDERPQLVNMYGITETTVHVTYRPLTLADVEGGAGSVIGVPIPDLYVRVLDPSGQPVPIGVSGEMYVGGAGVARGYLNRPELTAQRFVADPVTGDPAARVYRSGDLARWLEDGGLEYLGRIDHQVKIRGFRIELGEIESVLSQHPAVREAVVVAREDAPGDRRLVAYVAADAERGPLAEELRTRLRAVLPDYMVPSAFVFLDALPLTENGKVDRKALPQPDFSRPPTRAYVAPRNPGEETLATIWGAVLGVPQVGVHDHFFELGGDSILSIQVIARARAAGIRLTPRDLAQRPTIAELAAGLEPGRGESVAGSAPATGTAPLTPIQRWFFDLDLADPHHWNQAFLFESTTDLDGDRLGAALRAVAAHHDVLRLRFERGAAGWRQAHTPEQGHIPLEMVDLRALAPDARTSTIEATSATLQSSLNLETGPLARAALFRCGPEAGCRLLLVLHHLIVDGVSWRILLEDLERAYRGEALPPRTSTYQEWAQRLETHGASGAFRESLDYWRARGGSTLPSDRQGENLEASTRTVVVSLDRDETRALLQDVPAAFRTQINDALLAALGHAVAAWTGSARNLFDVEGHGREELFADVDLSRTLGWFTTIYPVTVALDPQAGPASALAAVREQLRCVPDRGLSYGVLRHLDAESAPALAAIPPAQVLFNYLGQFDQVLAGSRLFRFAEEPIGPWHCPRGRRTHAIEVVVWVKGGCLEARFQYSDQLHHAATIERVARSFRDGVLAIVDASRSAGVASHVPSDFPLVRVDQAAIDGLARDHAIEDLLPLSPMQRLFYAMDASGSGLGFEAWRFRLQGPLDPTALRAAWEAVLDRHSILRSVYVSEGLPEPLQVVVQRVKLDWAQEDWRTVPGDEQEARVRERLRDGQARGLDLSRPPLTRLVLLRVAEMTWELLWFTHHLQVDGWSWPLVLRDVSALYAAHSGATPTPPPPALPYRDYLAWLAGSAPDSEAFWRSSLSGLRAPTPVLPSEGRLETDAADPYGEESARLSAEATQSLRAFARDRKVTLSTLVQGAWAVALGHWSGEPEVTFGAVFSGRPAELPGIESMVGPCVNNLPLRVMLSGGQTVAQWLDGLQRHQFEVSQNQFASLADIQEWAHIPPRLRLFESLIVFQNYLVEEGARSLGAEVAIDVVSAPEATNYPVTLTVRPGTELQLRLLYHRDRARPATARAMLADLMTVLHELPLSADARLAALRSGLAPATAGWAASTRRALVTARVGPSSQTERRVAAIWAELFEADSVSVEDNFFDLGGHSLLLVRAHARLRGEIDERLPLVALLRYPTVRSLARYLDGQVAPATPDVIDRANRARAALSRRRAQQEKR
jgi:amino acid adenylation domain-containing protein/non-ribosomal peptide synthase protein (TIGR01720 family)